ncbi:MAG: alpha-L-rhamnosidase [Ruminococcaceae bacterium]|nr:alpha-L-rhamnosidase [Oscillospiraceae bacterium]
MDFKGKWIQPKEFDGLAPLNVYHRIGEPQHENITHPEELKNLHIHFIKDLVLTRKYEKVLLRVSADDYYKLKINGKFVCQGPAQGYFFNYYCNEVDITTFITEGSNTFDFEVYYQGILNFAFIAGDLRCGMICDVVGITGDSEALLLASGEDFSYYISSRWPERRLYDYGTQFFETYDGTAEEPALRPVSVNMNTDYTFSPEPLSPIKVYALKPAATEILENGMIFCDFGRETTGTLNLSAAGERGALIDIYYGEETEDTPIRTRYKMRCNCDYHDTWIMGSAEDNFEGFDYKAFRYITVAPPENVKITDITVAARHAEIDDDEVVLTTDNNLLSEIFEICRHGVRCGVQEGFTDCPSREKGQYAGDLTIAGSSYLWLTGDIKMYRKALENQMDSQVIDPGILSVTPASAVHAFADYSLQFPIIALREYDFSKDKEFLAKCLSASEKMLADFEEFKDDDGLLRDTRFIPLVDWPTNMRDGFDLTTKKQSVLNAFYVNAIRCVEKMRDILGIKAEKRFPKLAEAFNSVFFNSELGLYVDAPGSTHASLHSNVIPLYSEIVPAGLEDKIAGYIVERGMACGVYMSFFLLRALCRVGRYAEAYDLIVSRGEHSWYTMVKEGATSCFEAWGKEMKTNCSLCHPWSSSPITVLIEDICGWRPDGTRGENHAPDGTDVYIRRFDK